MTERQAVEIDFCPVCRGVWLDRAELDKIIDRSVGTAPTQTQQPVVEGYRDTAQREETRRQDDDDDYKDRKKKKRGGWLEDLLDFD